MSTARVQPIDMGSPDKQPGEGQAGAESKEFAPTPTPQVTQPVPSADDLDAVSKEKAIADATAGTIPVIPPPPPQKAMKVTDAIVTFLKERGYHCESVADAERFVNNLSDKDFVGFEADFAKWSSAIEKIFEDAPGPVLACPGCGNPTTRVGGRWMCKDAEGCGGSGKEI